MMQFQGQKRLLDPIFAASHPREKLVFVRLGCTILVCIFLTLSLAHLSLLYLNVFFNLIHCGAKENSISSLLASSSQQWRSSWEIRFL
jgi:hypothetical protein